MSNRQRPTLISWALSISCGVTLVTGCIASQMLSPASTCQQSIKVDHPLSSR